MKILQNLYFHWSLEETEVQPFRDWLSNPVGDPPGRPSIPEIRLSVDNHALAVTDTQANLSWSYDLQKENVL